MNNHTILSKKDKELLDSYDISIFKSAVAYLENARHSSCQPVKSQDRSPAISKSKILKEPQLFPSLDSRIEIISKKYRNHFKSPKLQKQENSQKTVNIFQNLFEKRGFQPVAKIRYSEEARTKVKN